MRANDQWLTVMQKSSSWKSVTETWLSAYQTCEMMWSFRHLSRCFMLCISAAYTSPPALHFSDKVREALSALARGHGRNQWPALTWRNQNPLKSSFSSFWIWHLWHLWHMPVSASLPTHQITKWLCDDVSRMQDANKSRSGEDPRISKCLRCRSRISFPGDGKVCVKWSANHFTRKIKLGGGGCESKMVRKRCKPKRRPSQSRWHRISMNKPSKLRFLSHKMVTSKPKDF